MNGLTKYEQLLHRHLSLRRALQDRNIVVEKDDNDQWAIDLADVKGVGAEATVHFYDFTGRPLGGITVNDMRPRNIPDGTYSYNVTFAAEAMKSTEACKAKFDNGENFGGFVRTTLDEVDRIKPNVMWYGIDHARWPKPWEVALKVDGGALSANIMGQEFKAEYSNALYHLLEALCAAIVGPSPAKVD